MAKEKLPTWPSGWNEDLNSRLEELGNNENERLLKTLEVPQKLKDFRKKWKENINLDEDTKKKIIDAVNEIQKWAKEESDGSMLVEFELWWKGYKALDVNVAEHSDNNLSLISSDYHLYTTNEVYTKNEVKPFDIWDNNTHRWYNRALADYVDKQRDTRGMEIRTYSFRRDLLDELWAKAGVTELSDKIAMWMYLTWNYGIYFLWFDGHPYESSFNGLLCGDHNQNAFVGCRGRDCIGARFGVSLCLIACN